jgi:hypothetical protein
MSEKKILSTELTASIADEFTDYISDNRMIKYRALEGSMKLFQAVPLEVQTQAMKESCGVEDVLQLLIDSLLNYEALRLLSALPPQDRLSMIRQLKKAREKFSQ